jgi:hypothetical protein
MRRVSPSIIKDNWEDFLQASGLNLNFFNSGTGIFTAKIVTWNMGIRYNKKRQAQ